MEEHHHSFSDEGTIENDYQEQNENLLITSSHNKK